MWLKSTSGLQVNLQAGREFKEVLAGLIARKRKKGDGLCQSEVFGFAIVIAIK